MTGNGRGSGCHGKGLQGPWTPSCPSEVAPWGEWEEFPLSEKPPEMDQLGPSRPRCSSLPPLRPTRTPLYLPSGAGRDGPSWNTQT